MRTLWSDLGPIEIEKYLFLQLKKVKIEKYLSATKKINQKVQILNHCIEKYEPWDIEMHDTP